MLVNVIRSLDLSEQSKTQHVQAALMQNRREETVNLHTGEAARRDFLPFCKLMIYVVNYGRSELRPASTSVFYCLFISEEESQLFL